MSDGAPQGIGIERRQTVLVWLVGVLATLAIAWALHVTVWVTMPLVAALFIAVAVWPVTDGIQKRVPRRLAWLGYVAAVSVIVLALALFVLGIWYSASQVAEQWPQYADEFRAYWDQLLSRIGAASQDSGGAAGGEEAQGGGGASGFVADYAVTIVESVSRIVATVVLIFFFVLLMLIEARIWYAKLADTTVEGRTGAWLDIVKDVARRFRWYLLIRTLLGLITGGLYGLWLWAWGVSFVVVWVLLAFLLNYVPTLGSLIAGLLPIAFAVLEKDLGTAAIIAVGILAIEQVMGNYVDPRVQGRQLSLSPLVVLFMLLAWGWIWGVAGALLAVPMTVLIVMVCARFPTLAPIALALSGERSRADLARRIGET